MIAIKNIRLSATTLGYDTEVQTNDKNRDFLEGIEE